MAWAASVSAGLAYLQLFGLVVEAKQENVIEHQLQQT